MSSGVQHQESKRLVSNSMNFVVMNLLQVFGIPRNNINYIVVDCNRFNFLFSILIFEFLNIQFYVLSIHLFLEYVLHIIRIA